MVNPGEASVNVVTKDKPKVLSQNGDSRARLGAAAKSGLGQKRHVVRLRCSELTARRWRTTGEETRPKPPWRFHLRNVVSP